MLDVLALDGMVNMSISHPYSVVHYKIISINVNLIKYHVYSDSDVLSYALVKDYSFSGSGIRPYIHTFVCPY